jgi:hypothetical protein
MDGFGTDAQVVVLAGKSIHIFLFKDNLIKIK